LGLSGCMVLRGVMCATIRACACACACVCVCMWGVSSCARHRGFILRVCMYPPKNENNNTHANTHSHTHTRTDGRTLTLTLTRTACEYELAHAHAHAHAHTHVHARKYANTNPNTNRTPACILRSQSSPRKWWLGMSLTRRRRQQRSRYAM
jgi:hypothetical protein